MGVTVRRGHKGLQSIETGIHDGPILVFADYTKLFLLETDVSKDGLGVVLSQKQADSSFWH